MLINNDLRMVVDPPTAFRGALFLECLYLLMEAGSSIIIRGNFGGFGEMKTHWEIRLSLLHSCVMKEYM